MKQEQKTTERIKSTERIIFPASQFTFFGMFLKHFLNVYNKNEVKIVIEYEREEEN